MTVGTHKDLVSVVYEDYHMVKSAEDKRIYRVLEMKNDMRVLLVSDPDTDKSSAALDVNIGFMSDPWELQGLAHFCEHMLFLGTEKYPEENEYSKFLSEHGGSSNAFTCAEHTNFYFDVNPENLSHALDMFAQFFLKPLFTPSSTDREVNAVNSENDKNLQSDTWRLEQLERSTSNPRHDFSKFGTGNKTTLQAVPGQRGVNNREELLKFHNKFYSSNIMSLVVLGAETIEELTDMVLPLFSKVSNKNVTVPAWSVHPFVGYLKIKANIVPVKDVRSLNVTWPIPDLDQHYTSQPGGYISHLIGHEGEGSLLSELKRRGWSNSLVSGQKTGARGFMMFSVGVDLTEEGLNHCDDIILLIFQYINMLRNVGPQEWIFKECQELNALEFRFKDKERPRKLTSVTAQDMRLYPLPEILSGPYLLHNYRPDLITEVLDCLIPDKVRIGMVSRTFKGKTTLKEKWYGTNYHLESISDEQIQAWTNCGVDPNLKLPPANEFIATNFDLVGKNAESQLPEILKQTDLYRLWYKLDTKYLLPKACMSFELRTPLAYQDPLQANMCHLFIELLKDSLTEYSYAAEIADLGYNLNPTLYGMQFSVKGYNDKQPVLIRKIIEKLAHISLDRKRYEILKELCERSLRNFEMEQPSKHASYYTSLLISEQAWTKAELLEALSDVTFEGLELFAKRLLSRLYIEGLVYGNISKQSAVNVIDMIEDILKKESQTKPISASQHKRLREVQMPDGCYYQFVRNNDVHKSSCIEIYYQTGMQSTRANVLLELFCQIISEPCFNILRTQEQLGYIVFSGTRRSSGVQGLRVVVQSDKHPNFVEMRVEFFLLKMRTLLNEMNDEDFAKHVSALVSQKLEEPKKLSGKHGQYWNEIACQQFNFDRETIEVADLKSLTKDDLLNFYNAAIAFDGPQRRKLSVHILSTAPTPNDESRDVDTTDGHYPIFNQRQKKQLIEDIMEFKRDLPLFPLAKPYVDLHESKSKL